MDLCTIMGNLDPGISTFSKQYALKAQYLCIFPQWI